jgi:hypothetical protein
MKMADVFISHAEEDTSLASDIADAIERLGFSAWYYERDTILGKSYILQVGEAIDTCRVVILLISSHSLGSHQVTKEVVRAHESNKPFMPLLTDVSHGEFQTRQPEWRTAVGAAASVRIPPEGVSRIVPQLTRGLSALGLHPAERAAISTTATEYHEIQHAGQADALRQQDATRARQPELHQHRALRRAAPHKTRLLVGGGIAAGVAFVLLFALLHRPLSSPIQSAQRAGCQGDEIATLGKVVPIYVQWHTSRHAEWGEDEVKDPILEAMAKEEEGQEGTTRGRGPVFQLMLPLLEAADAAKAERVKSGTRASVVLQELRAGKAERQGAVARLHKDFEPSLTCLSTSRPAIEYLTRLNQMPNFPTPIVDPEGPIGRFVGAYMRKHVIVNHDQFTRHIVISALNAYKDIQPSAKQSVTRAASLALIEKALEKLEPKIAAEVRQGRGEKARKDFLDGEADLKKRQTKATKDYEDAYQMLAKAYKEALTDLAPQS